MENVKITMAHNRKADGVEVEKMRFKKVLMQKNLC
jgi:hypothetical protein